MDRMIHRFSLLEHVLLRRDVLPHPLLDAGALVGAAKALTSAVRLGLTAHLGEAPRQPADLSQACGLSERGTVALLDCLDALGYVRRTNAGYALTRRGRIYLDPRSERSMLSMLRFMDRTYDSFTDVEHTLRTGAPRRNNLEHFTAEQWEDFSLAMLELAKTNVDEVSRSLAVPAEARRALDLGGCHGLYSVELCRRHPRLAAEVLDLEATRRYFTETVGAHAMAERVRFRAGDFMKDDLGENYDVVLAFNIVHGFDSAQNLELVRKVRQALRAGGVCVIVDQIKEAAGATDLAKLTTAFMAFNLLHQAGGFTYSIEEVERWAVEAGFRSTQMKKLRAPGFALVTLTS